MTQCHYPHYRIAIATVMIVLYMAVMMESLVLYQECTVMLIIHSLCHYVLPVFTSAQLLIYHAKVIVVL